MFWGCPRTPGRPDTADTERNLANSNIAIRKKRGRPRVGETPVVSLRLNQGSQQDIDEWRSGEPDHLSRSEAIRTLIWIGLAAAYKERKRDGRRGELCSEPYSMRPGAAQIHVGGLPARSRQNFFRLRLWFEQPVMARMSPVGHCTVHSAPGALWRHDPTRNRSSQRMI
jgi:hypothetical protein